MPPMDDLSRPRTPPPLPREQAAAAASSSPPVVAAPCRCTWHFVAGVLVGLLFAAAVLGVMGGACRPDPAPGGDEEGLPVDQPYEPPPLPTKSALRASDPGEQQQPSSGQAVPK